MAANKDTKKNNNKSNTVAPLSDEEKYLKAAKLTKAIHCLKKDRDKANMYNSIAKIYKSLGGYLDSEELYAKAVKNAEKHRKLAEEYEKEHPVIGQTGESDNQNSGKGILRKVILSLIGILLIVAVAGAIYAKTKPGRYARASFYEKIGNYEKSYKMFGNLKTYKDSESRSIESRYEYADDCVIKGKLESAKKAYRALGNYKDSEQSLNDVEIEIIRNTEVGGNVLFGEAHWLIAEKEDNKVLLIKSLPVNGYAYHNKPEDITWENCSLRATLNDEYLRETFNEPMIASILDTKIEVPDNSKYGTVGGNSTVDKIFLLNDQEATKYSELLSNYNRDFWLINPGSSQSSAQFVSFGEIMDYGYDVTNTNINIRPALWVSIERLP